MLCTLPSLANAHSSHTKTVGILSHVPMRTRRLALFQMNIQLYKSELETQIAPYRSPYEGLKDELILGMRRLERDRERKCALSSIKQD